MPVLLMVCMVVEHRLNPGNSQHSLVQPCGGRQVHLPNVNTTTSTNALFKISMRVTHHVMPFTLGLLGCSILHPSLSRHVCCRIRPWTQNPRYLVLTANAQRKHEIIQIPIGLRASIKLE